MRKIPIRWPDPLKLIRAECNIKICPDATDLRLKVMLFKSRTQMRRFFLLAMKIRMHPAAEGYCCGFSLGDKLDPRFFAIILLPVSVLNAGSIAHEAVHAAHRFVERTDLKWPGCEEEKIAYPAGYITGAIMEWLADLKIRCRGTVEFDKKI